MESADSIGSSYIFPGTACCGNKGKPWFIRHIGHAKRPETSFEIATVRERKRESEKEGESCHLAVSLRRCIIATDLRFNHHCLVQQRASPTRYFIFICPRFDNSWNFQCAKGKRERERDKVGFLLLLLLHVGEKSLFQPTLADSQADLY